MPPSRSGRSTALNSLERQRPTTADPLVHHGRHFGRTVHPLCNVHVLFTNAIIRATDEEYATLPQNGLPPEERREKSIYESLLQLVPGLESDIMNATPAKLREMADFLQKGAASARSDDTKSLKGPILDWITPRGVPLNPPIARNSKIERGFHHEATGALLCPANLDWSNPDVKKKLRNAEYIVPGDNWPILLYKDYRYDPHNPWAGLLRSRILVLAYKHVFTSPSSVDKEPKATRSGNARIHGMEKVTIASIAYIATQVRFALSSSQAFSRSDRVTDHQRFYNSIVEFLEDPEEQEEVADLLTFWNRHVFPEFSSAKQITTKDSALARLKEARAQRQASSSASQ